MRKAFQYRIYPTKSQTQNLLEQLEECRWLYNYFIEHRKTAWDNDQKSIGYYEQKRQIPILKMSNPKLKSVHSQVLQNVALRVDLAFQAFFRRLKSKEDKAGYPRFKGQDRYDSLTYTQSGFAIEDGKLRLSKVGKVKIKLHRSLIGNIKTLTVRKNQLGQWYACFSVDVECEALPPTNKTVGIDVGLYSFATYSDGTVIPNPRFFRKAEKGIKDTQSKYSKHQGKKAKRSLAKQHIKTANKRKDFCHKLSRQIINDNDTIFIEDLNINKMVKNHRLSKSIHDAAWNQFAQFLIYKAEEAGRKIVQVNPAYTSQDCSQCGYRVLKTLSDRIHKCSNCGLEIDRDFNASLNIFRLGTSLSAKGAGSPRL